MWISYDRAMPRRPRSPLRTCALTLLAGALACGGGEGESDTDGGELSGDGQVYAPFDTLCLATFDAEATAVDVFGDELFTIASGSRYLFTFDPFDDVVMLHLSSAGPVDFLVEAEPGAEPYTLSCAEGATERFVGVFADVTIYSDAQLSTELCSLEAGTLWPSAGGGSSAEGDLLADPSIYFVEYDGLADQCGGAGSGYIAVNFVSLLGSMRAPVPLAVVEGPA